MKKKAIKFEAEISQKTEKSIYTLLNQLKNKYGRYFKKDFIGELLEIGLKNYKK